MLDHAMAVAAFIILPLDFPAAQPLRLPFMLLLAVYGLVHWRRVWPVIWSGRWLFVLPGLCLLSVLWADNGLAALRHGGIIAVAMGIAALFAARLDPRQIAVTLLMSQGILAIASLSTLTMAWVGGVDGGYALVGVFPHKNVLGTRMMFLILAGVCILVGRGYGALWRMASIVLIPIALFLIALSLSATAVLLLAGAVPMAVILALIWRPAGQVKGARPALLFGGAALGLLTLLILINGYGFQPIDNVLEAFGKDRTLTGRTDIWAMAGNAIAERPWLGTGAGNFWAYDNWTAARLAARFHTDPAHFTFHNLYVEVAVHLGILGLAASLAVYGTAMMAAVRQWWRTQGTADPLYITLIAVFAIRSLAEAEMFRALLLAPMLFWLIAFQALASAQAKAPR